MTDVHAHEVMHMMLEQGGVFSRESLTRAITEHFGKEARFCSCSASGMDINAVLKPSLPAFEEPTVGEIPDQVNIGTPVVAPGVVDG